MSRRMTPTRGYSPSDIGIIFRRLDEIHARLSAHRAFRSDVGGRLKRDVGAVSLLGDGIATRARNIARLASTYTTKFDELCACCADRVRPIFAFGLQDASSDLIKQVRG